MKDCLFCKLVAGEIPSKKVYEDDYVFAFDDIEPEAPVHTLIVPKEHYESLKDNVPEDLLGKLLATVPKIAEIKGIDETGFRILVNTGEDAAATVPHLHIHVMGGVRFGRSTFEGSWREQ